MTVAWLATGEYHRATEHIQRGEQRGRAVALVAMGDVLAVANPMGSIGRVRSSAWHGLFSATQMTSALFCGLRYGPTTSRSFSMKNGSLESLKFLVR